MENKNLFHILQFAGSSYPVGGFSQSWGLETCVKNGQVRDAEDLIGFLTTYLDVVIGRQEGVFVCQAHRLAEQGDLPGLAELEVLSTATKLTKESRGSSLRMGRAFLRIAASALEDPSITDFYEGLPRQGVSYAVAYGFVCGRLGLPRREAAAAFVFSTVNAIVQSGVKLIPLGNTEAQALLICLGGAMDRATAEALEAEPEQVTTFCPGLDLAGCEHETLPVRLYMS